MHTNFAFVFVLAIQVIKSDAWLLPWASSDDSPSSSLSKASAGLEKAPVGSISSNVDTDFEIEETPEDEELENEEYQKCSQHFQRKLFRVLKSYQAQNSTQRGSRQVGQAQESPDELVTSFLDLDFPQVFGPVLKLVTSAAASNATAIDQSYNELPYAVRSGVTDVIRFVIDLIDLEGEALTT